jgi:hypothetical protein
VHDLQRTRHRQDLVSGDFAGRDQLRLRVTAPSAVPNSCPIFTSPGCDRSFSSSKPHMPFADGQQRARNLCYGCVDEQRAAASDRPFAKVFGTMFGYMEAVILSAPTPSRKVQASKPSSAASRNHSRTEIVPAATRWAFGPSDLRRGTSRGFSPLAHPRSGGCSGPCRRRTLNTTPNPSRAHSGGRHLRTHQDQLTAPAMTSGPHPQGW